MLVKSESLLRLGQEEFSIVRYCDTEPIKTSEHHILFLPSLIQAPSQVVEELSNAFNFKQIEVAEILYARPRDARAVLSEGKKVIQQIRLMLEIYGPSIVVAEGTSALFFVHAIEQNNAWSGKCLFLNPTWTLATERHSLPSPKSKLAHLFTKANKKVRNFPEAFGQLRSKTFQRYVDKVSYILYDLDLDCFIAVSDKDPIVQNSVRLSLLKQFGHTQWQLGVFPWKGHLLSCSPFSSEIYTSAARWLNRSKLRELA